MEWSPERAFNPMNSVAKGLTYFEQMQKILGWLDGKNELPPPIEASLDPTAACNNRCYYCSSNQYIDKDIKRWGREYLEDVLCKIVLLMGVKGLCWGGREATMNLRLAEANRTAVLMGLETAIVTNGVYLTHELLKSLMLCKWIGISVDTNDPAIYKAVRGTDDCEKVWKNIERYGKGKTTTTVGVRALILPETIPTLYEVAYRARESGANFVHIRPADLDRKDLHIAQKMNLNVKRVKGILEKCHELETPDFGVFTIFHKFDESFKVTHKFKRCLAAPLVIQVCANKSLYACVDHRLDERFKVGDFSDWGSEKHRQLLLSIKPDEECSRCTWSVYNELMEQVVKNDLIHRNFP